MYEYWKWWVLAICLLMMSTSNLLIKLFPFTSYELKYKWHHLEASSSNFQLPPQFVQEATQIWIHAEPLPSELWLQTELKFFQCKSWVPAKMENIWPVICSLSAQEKIDLDQRHLDFPKIQRIFGLYVERWLRKFLPGFCSLQSCLPFARLVGWCQREGASLSSL